MIKYIKHYGMIALGSCLTAFAFGIFVLPQGFAAGGITGFAVLMRKIIPLPVSVLVYMINFILFALG